MNVFELECKYTWSLLKGSLAVLLLSFCWEDLGIFCRYFVAAEAAVQKTLTQNRHNIPRSSQQTDESKIAKPPFYQHWDFRIF
jgi:hypothetical protein